jgi:hypothetical protein
MGIMWTVWPLDGDMINWLRSQNIEFPGSASRFPTGFEIKRVLADPALQVNIHDNGKGKTFQALIETKADAKHRWANLMITDYTGDEEPQKLYFEKGDETLIWDILKQLTAHSGPLVLIDDAGDPPRVITPDAEIDVTPR